MPEPVLFYGHRFGPYRAFSNWYPALTIIYGHTWATSKHAFVSQKSNDQIFQQRLRLSSDPKQAKVLGRGVHLHSDWDRVKFDIMVDVCHAKFSQNPDLRELLLGTTSRPIHENCSDQWWGGGPHYPNGKDLLGKALMAVRARLQAGDVFVEEATL